MACIFFCADGPIRQWSLHTLAPSFATRIVELTAAGRTADIVISVRGFGTEMLAMCDPAAVAPAANYPNVERPWLSSLAHGIQPQQFH